MWRRVIIRLIPFHMVRCYCWPSGRRTRSVSASMQPTLTMSISVRPDSTTGVKQDSNKFIRALPLPHCPCFHLILEDNPSANFLMAKIVDLEAHRSMKKWLMTAPGTSTSLPTSNTASVKCYTESTARDTRPPWTSEIRSSTLEFHMQCVGPVQLPFRSRK
ncbi:hypothetical protein MPH_03888 [Macrophomina phaseolina MS6]|uniref:Secreted protein n=1 Tax=Macrophomina phaseolina (strain MS6) TaxID=1126212 RepID=K2S1K8_MACPH|nr:hypothetical protein MPH_03888 [Macrophomina phaseolina MS6]